MPTAARRRFEANTPRARAQAQLAETLPDGTPEERMVRSDLLRGAWMLAVGALDCYFCDAYSDLLRALMRSKSRHPPLALPEWFGGVKVPLDSVLEPYVHEGRRWRRMADELMERESVLSLPAIQTLLNKCLRQGHRFFGDILDGWMRHPDCPHRMAGTTPSAYSAMNEANRTAARQAALPLIARRFRIIFQRRHDISHTCDCPREAVPPLERTATVEHVIEDIEFLVRRCDEHLDSEFPQFLAACGCPAPIIRQAGY
ncbi:MAG: hypothetical protein K2W96_11935 [Gemmataceae bacterium]|nr:hypothetical protein [Gemmataceae bacterium]